MRRVILVASCVVAATAACKKPQDGLPPATAWQAAGSGAEPPELTPPIGMGRMGGTGGMGGLGSNPDDPHAGLDLNGDPDDPHAGVDLGEAGDPHAGLDPSRDPHAGGVDVTRLGLAAPDPERPIDPSHRVTGVIRVGAGARRLVKPGAAVFLIVKRAGSNGEPVGSPLAVDKLTWTDDGVAFELTDAEAMIAGTELAGDVIVSARYDQDGDAMTKQPGDVTGQVRLKIPADHVQLTLDTVLP